jgi:hypothetical protein
MATVIASNISALFAKAEATPGTFEAPAGTDAIRVVGTAKFTPRGAQLIQRADVMSPYGGAQASARGSLGWDITFQTELYFDASVTISSGGANGFLNQFIANSRLAALFAATPLGVSVTPTDTLNAYMQPIYLISNNTVRTGPLNCSIQPCTIVYEEQGGNRYAATGCVGSFKISADYGQRVLIDWTFKGLWEDPSASVDLAPTWNENATDTYPRVMVNAAVTLPYTNAVTAVTKFAFDPGYALTDVGNSIAANGMAIAMVALTNAPTIDLEVADLPQGVQDDWSEALLGVNQSYSPTIVSLDFGGTANITFALPNSQVMLPVPADRDGYRALGLKFIHVSTSASNAYITFTADP